MQGVVLGTTFLADAVATSGYQSGRSGTILSDVWTVDGVDVVYVEAGGAACESDSCWEWLLITQPDCATATVTVEISDSVYGDTQREIERSVTSDRVTSVLIEAELDDGEYADLTSISCD